MRRLDGAVFLSGAALMGLEIVGSRVLAPVFGTSIFVWGALITTFLASLSVGYALGGRIADRRPDPALLALFLAAAGCLLWLLFYEPSALLTACAAAPVPDRFRSLLAALVLFAPPSVLMGMATPFAVRLAARDLSSIGSATGRLSAVSTAGSILGTFAMSFLLIPAFATRPILFGLGAALLVAAALLPGALTVGRALAGVVLVAGTGTAYLMNAEAGAVRTQNGVVIHEKETAYHHIRVVDLGARRGMYFDNQLQGWVDLKTKNPPPTYIDGLLTSLALRQAPPKRIVCIGMGPGMIPTVLARRVPDVSVTTIEIDPEVVKIAERFFELSPDANDTIVVGDGRRELLHQTEKADVILMDAFFSDSQPFHLLTEEFHRLCRERLTPDGVVAANLAGQLMGSKNALFWAAAKTLRKVFPRVYIFSQELSRGDPLFSGPAMLMATHSYDRLDPATIRERAAEWAKKLERPGIAEWGAWLYEGELRESGLPVLTDAYAPTDALQHLVRR